MLTIKLFPIILLVISVVTTIGFNLSIFPSHQIATGISQSPQFQSPQLQLQQQNSTSITANDTTIFDLQSNLLNSIFNQVQNSDSTGNFQDAYTPINLFIPKPSFN